MMQSELESMTELNFTTEEFSVIEFVYMWHPSISDAHGKREINGIFHLFGKEKGLRLIKDMMPSAQEGKRLEDNRDIVLNKLNKIQEEIDSLLEF